MSVSAFPSMNCINDDILDDEYSRSENIIKLRSAHELSILECMSMRSISDNENILKYEDNNSTAKLNPELATTSLKHINKVPQLDHDLLRRLNLIRDQIT